MGYRLGIDRVIPAFYGSKLYGYVSNMDDLPSVRFLVEKGYFKDPESIYDGIQMRPSILADCEALPDFTMSAKDFRDFMQLYGDEVNKYNPFWGNGNDFLKDPDIADLMEDDTDKHLSWG